jgi:hypothetical protein
VQEVRTYFSYSHSDLLWIKHFQDFLFLSCLSFVSAFSFSRSVHLKHQLQSKMSTPTSTSAPYPTSTSSSDGCISFSPGKHGYVPPSACNAQWAYAPSFSGAIAFSTFFGTLTLAHLILAILFRKPFCWVMIMGVAWELIAFVTRALGAHDQQNIGYATVSSIFFLLAPLWINAFVYMTVGRLPGIWKEMGYQSVHNRRFGYLY